MFNTVRNSYKPTVEDCYMTLAQLPNGKYKTVNIVDTAGSMEFPAMIELRIRSATAVIIVYSVISSDSMNRVSAIKKQVRKIREYDEVPIIVVGNLKGSNQESPLYERAVSEAPTDDSCQHMFKELSDSKHCKEIFEKVIRICYESNTGLIQVFNSQKDKTDQADIIPRKRSLFSYLSFRRKKGDKSLGRVRSAKSML
ncbi:ras-related protein Rap-2b-like [Watersipora subatra]|uniref:ras-related protein Rap-2b-like n=1 Tax=Watersipora subatra TaxID=2589382 RepID=UPI00355BC46B